MKREHFSLSKRILYIKIRTQRTEREREREKETREIIQNNYSILVILFYIQCIFRNAIVVQKELQANG